MEQTTSPTKLITDRVSPSKYEPHKGYHIFNALVFEEGSPERYFRSEIEATDFSHAIRTTVSTLLEAHADSGSPSSSPLIIVLTMRDKDVPPCAWKLFIDTKEYCPHDVPCCECLGAGVVDSGGFDPQDRPINIPCPSCSPQPKDPNSKPDLKAWTEGKAEEEARIQLRAWQEAFGTSQLTHALERLKQAEKQAGLASESANIREAHNTLQDNVWASMGRYSEKLGWGLTGIQPECWTCLDSAVEELVKTRKNISALRELLLVPEYKSDDAVLQAAKLLKGMYEASQGPVECSCYEPGRVTDPKCRIHGK